MARRFLSRRRILGAAAALGAAHLVACSRKEAVRVGFLGGVSDFGVGGRNGAQLAVDDRNAAGVQFVVDPMTSLVAAAVAPRALERWLRRCPPQRITTRNAAKLPFVAGS